MRLYDSADTLYHSERISQWNSDNHEVDQQFYSGNYASVVDIQNKGMHYNAKQNKEQTSDYWHRKIAHVEDHWPERPLSQG